MKLNLISMGEIALRRGGSVDPKKHPSEVFELYSIPAFDAGAPEVVTGSAIGSSKKVVQPNDVMISRIVPHIRRACVVGPSNGHRQIASSEWIIFRDERIWPRYLRWVLVGDVFHSAFMRTVSGVGGSLLRARPAEVFKIQVPLPPLAEQKRIAGILDAADALRAKRREALAQLDTLLQSTFLDMFGDPVTNPMGWKEHSIGDCVGKCQTWNPKSSGAGSFDYIDLSSVDKDTKSIASTERCECSDAPSRARQLVEADDVLVATVRPNLNGVALVNGAHHGMTASTGYCVLRPDKDKLDSRFLFHWVKTDVFVRRMVDVATGANYPAVSAAKVKSSKIPVPPLKYQHRFATIAAFVQHQKASQQAHWAELDTLFASLQSRAFRGGL